MSNRLTLTAIYEPVEDGWTQARLTEIPGVITAAPTRAEAREYLVDALREYLLALGERGEPAEALTQGASREPLCLLIGA